ncbi:hypothetical protein CRENPOLYSF1_550017 [Crenothrix polyspora]|uniref:Uncharacterized protein n=1 Tax=Crenothrix polyspora TaxID=360316 RepID=A0A1R4HE61_9GAMM|nr:hypothetical protein CRENPOLYSF1_550017 [Crenothrix polyspora]
MEIFDKVFMLLLGVFFCRIKRQLSKNIVYWMLYAKTRFY